MDSSLSRVEGLVSVVIPCYNHGAYLDDAVRSVRDQSYPHVELVVVDDGSDDPVTLRELDRLAEDGVRVIHQENGHLSAARNRGVLETRGEYLLPLDADDRLAPRFIEKTVRVLSEDPSVGVATTHVVRFDAEGPTGTVYQLSGGALVDFLVRNQACAGSLFRYQCWQDAGGYDESMRDGSEDWEFWISVTEQGWIVRSIPEPLYEYREVTGSLYDRTRPRRADAFRQIVRRHPDAFRDHLEEVLYAKEVRLQEAHARADRAADQVRQSWSYRVGAVLLWPVRWLRRKGQS